MRVSRRHTIMAALGAAATGCATALKAGSAVEGPRGLEIPIRLTSERLWTSFDLSASEQHVAIFDTGGFVSKISEELAFRLDLKRDGTKVGVEGLGGSETGRWVVADRPMIGGVFQPDKMWFLTSKTLDKQPFKMLVGTDWLAKITCEFDLNAAMWRLFDKSAPDFTGYTKIANSYKSSGPSTMLQIQADIGGFKGRFHCDTGSPTNVLLDGRASGALKIWDTKQPYAPWRIGGFGPNRLNSRLYRQDKASLADFALERPLALLCDPSRSSSVIAGFDGLIGLKTLRNFNMLLDEKSKALWLKPNGIDFASQERYPMSGLWLEQRDGAIVVDEVGHGSPAAGAGIVAGDVIAGADWDMLRKQINADAGTLVAFDLEHAGKRSRAEFTLRPFL